MSTRRNDSSPSTRLLTWSLAFLLLVFALPLNARLLFLEDPLRSLTPLGEDRQRIEFGSEHFGALGWTGQRHTLRYEGTRGPHMVWSLTVPWLYSSYNDTGETGRDNLRAGLIANMSGLRRGLASLAAELWLPFSEDRLYPLQQHRAFARATAQTAFTAASLRWRGAFSYRWELQGVGPETVGGRWPERYVFSLRTERPMGRWGLIGEGAVSVSGRAATWSRAGGGVWASWSELWRAELMAETTLGNQDDRDLYDYRISLRISREMLRSEEPEPGAEPGEDELPPAPGQAPAAESESEDQAEKGPSPGGAPEDKP